GRQGHRRIDRDDKGRLPGGLERRDRRTGGSARWAAANALETGRADLVVAVLARDRALHRTAGRRGAGRAAVVLGLSAGRRERVGARAGDASESFEFFSERIGPYQYGKLAHVEAAGMGGGTEHVSNIFYGEKSVTAGQAPVVHETAHQWFGDAVTENDWNDVWLSEGFATYFTLLFTEYSAGRDAFVDGLRRSRAAVLRLENSLPNTPVVHANFNEGAEGGPNNRLVYEKGGWTLHMLRDQIGTDAFWRGIRLYYQRHMNGLATTAD